jgi:hypothetical protein
MALRLTHLARRSLKLVGTLLLVVTSGCLIIPIPNARIEGNGMRSKVVDADTGQPVAGARVSTVDYEKRVAVADAHGDFSLDPHVQWHAAYLWGVIGYPIWPFTGDAISSECSVLVEVPGYRATRFDVDFWREKGGLDAELTTDGYLIVSSLAIRRVTSSSTQPTPWEFQDGHPIHGR